MSKKEFIIILFITCAVVLFWVVANIYHERLSTTLSPELQQALEPITPTFDQSTISKIQQLNTNTLTPPATPTPIPTFEKTPAASSSGSLLP